MRRLVTAILIAGSTACAGEADQPRFSVRDSAGIQIVESSAPRWEAGKGEGWTVDSVPFLNLGSSGTGAAHEFSQAVGALRLTDGSIVVADAASRQIRKFSTDGRSIWTAGRQGDGPGEFNRLRSVSRFRGDSLLAYDFWLGRATVFSATGQVGRVISTGAAASRVERIHWLNDSLLIAEFNGWELIEMKPGLIRPPSVLVRTTLAGAVLDTIAIVPGHESVQIPDGDAPALFGRDGHTAIFKGQVIYGSANEFSFTVYQGDGAPVRIVRAPADLRLSAADVERERSYLLSRIPGQDPYTRKVFEQLPAPTHRPGYSQLVVDHTGAVWLRPYHGQSERGRDYHWQVFSPEGEWLGTVALPERFRVREIGLDYLLGVGLDEDDVEQVQVRRLHRR